MSESEDGRLSMGDRERQASMTFTEIGNALGIPRRNAYLIYRRAIRKLQARPQSLAKLVALAAEIDKHRRSEYE